MHPLDKTPEGRAVPKLTNQLIHRLSLGKRYWMKNLPEHVKVMV